MGTQLQSAILSVLGTDAPLIAWAVSGSLFKKQFFGATAQEFFVLKAGPFGGAPKTVVYRARLDALTRFDYIMVNAGQASVVAQTDSGRVEVKTHTHPAFKFNDVGNAAMTVYNLLAGMNPAALPESTQREHVWMVLRHKEGTLKFSDLAVYSVDMNKNPLDTPGRASLIIPTSGVKTVEVVPTNGANYGCKLSITHAEGTHTFEVASSLIAAVSWVEDGPALTGEFAYPMADIISAAFRARSFGGRPAYMNPDENPLYSAMVAKSGSNVLSMSLKTLVGSRYVLSLTDQHLYVLKSDKKGMAVNEKVPLAQIRDARITRMRHEAGETFQIEFALADNRRLGFVDTTSLQDVEKSFRRMQEYVLQRAT